MIICPWCGTNYIEFQSNCRNCGGPIPVPAEPQRSPEQQREGLFAETIEQASQLPAPPPPPRPISNSYAWRLFFTDGWAISAIVFTIIGATFLPVGIVMIIALVTIMVGIPFLGLGVLFFTAGLGVLIWRYQYASRVVQVLQNGTAVQGKILDVQVNTSVEINGRNPWTITYAFDLDGQEYQGKATTLNQPGWQLRPGFPAWVLHLPGQPQQNALYPHP